jgi:hypothetical protein
MAGGTSGVENRRDVVAEGDRSSLWGVAAAAYGGDGGNGDPHGGTEKQRRTE